MQSKLTPVEIVGYEVDEAGNIIAYRKILKAKKGVKCNMANQLKKTRTITDKVAVKGILSEDGTVITYMNDKVEEEITIAECLKNFLGKPIDFSISIKSEDELPDEDDE